MSSIDVQIPVNKLVEVKKYWVLAVVSLTTFMVFVDTTVVNTAMPSIARDFGATNSALQWVVNSYSLLWRVFCSLAVRSATATAGRRRSP
ncbi:MAG: hypothetical protein IH962_04370 [Chloroflexi bacterium]|nr:hypothetical protein [Chloroflexota bacterium]